MWRFVTIFGTAVCLTLLACKPDDGTTEEIVQEITRIDGPYNPQPYNLEIPDYLPKMIIPADNPLTVDGVELGRHLFYDPILSVDSTISCSSCHLPELNFTDNRKVSFGVNGVKGDRSSMSLINVGFSNGGLFWDGRAKTLEAQALIPVEDHREMNDNWENVEQKLRKHPTYPVLFRKAFGISDKKEITKELASKAIAQFERTLVSGNSRFDQVVYQNTEFPTDEEFRGKYLFYFEEAPIGANHPGCSHCHGGPLFTDQTFRNNGIENVATLQDFPDKGFGTVTGNAGDNGKFKVPTLRNIALTPPYMHDGRFQTLEEVLDHYSSGGHDPGNRDVNILKFTLTEQDKKDLITFLNMLTDTSFVNNPKFKSPFK